MNSYETRADNIEQTRPVVKREIRVEIPGSDSHIDGVYRIVLF